MNKLILGLILMVSAIFSGAFASGFTVTVSASEPSQLIVDVGSGASTMAKKSMLIKNTVALNTQAESNTASMGTQYVEGTGGYISGLGAKITCIKCSSFKENVYHKGG